MNSRSAETYLVVGAGFSGAVLARELAEQLDCRVIVIDSRAHVAGNCHTERDAATGVMVHTYGPHIFNTDRRHVWDYVNRFGVLRPHVNRVKASTARGIFSFPINLHTINQFFGKKLGPEAAREFLASLGDKSIGEPRNFEEQALKFIGRELYETFYGYTRKQGCEPAELPASVLKRLPIRFTYNDSYYDRALQGIPEHGYTAIVDKILDHPAITVRLATPFDRAMEAEYAHTFFTGLIDAYFGYELGRLGYRTITFDRIEAEGDYQGNGVINYTELEPAQTRVHEHKHFTPWETHARTVAFTEFSKETGPGDVAYYPKRLAADQALLAEYRLAAAKQRGVSFVGRLGTYRYLDMDTVIDEALQFAAHFVKSRQAGTAAPVFPTSRDSQRMTNSELSVVMPVYNEEANIAAVVTEWVTELQRLGIAFDLLAINDGSRDGTGRELARLAAQFPGCVTPMEKINGGHGLACRQGYEWAVQRGTAWTLQIDSDGQCDPRFFAAFWNGREEADAIYGLRTSRDDGWARVMISTVARAATSLLCGFDLKDANVPYRLMRTSVLAEALARVPVDFDMQNTALTVALRRRPALRWKYVPIHFRDRQGGANSINLRRIASMGFVLLRNLHRVGK